MKRFKFIVRVVVINIVLLIGLLVGLEAVLLLVFNQPSHLGGPLKHFYREFHLKYERNIIQLLPQCAQYDPALFYTLRPGRCLFVNREFESEFRINSLGVRDNETSLQKPEIVVLGDSHAMGWGVGQNETFPELIENVLNKKTLNAAVASYGTAREMTMLARIDTSNLKYLIIQYCANDFGENKTYYENKNALPIRSEQEYNHVVDEHIHAPKYRFGRYVYELQQLLINGLIKKSGIKQLRSIFGQQKENRPTLNEEARMYINALVQSHVDLREIHIIVFEVDQHARNDATFINSLKAEIAANSYPPYIENMSLLDLSSELKKDKYFLKWDGHLNKAGHKYIADSLVPLLQS